MSCHVENKNISLQIQIPNEVEWNFLLGVIIIFYF